MELTYNKINLGAHESQGQKPGDLITRGHANEVWFVPFSPLDFQNPPDWRHYRRERHVYIPVFPYLVPNNPADALGFAFQLGVRAIHDLGGKPARRLHLAIGEPVNQVFDETLQDTVWQFYMGFGVVLER